MLVDVAFKMKCKYKYTVGFFLLEMRRPLFVQICLSFDCIVELSNKIAAIIYQCSFAKYLAKSCLKNIYFFLTKYQKVLLNSVFNYLFSNTYMKFSSLASSLKSLKRHSSYLVNND